MKHARVFLLFLPLIALAGLIAIFASRMDRNPAYVQSVLIERPAPVFDMDAVEGLDRPGFSRQTLVGEVSVVNVFASWCVPCRDEHPMLEALKTETGVRLLGINHKDAPANARAFLAELGNPYDAVGSDANGRVSIDWGVYGVPETFVVDTQGIVTYKHVGPISLRSLREEVIPAVLGARAQ